MDISALIDALVEREGGYVAHPADKGGPTCFGITEAVARAHGYAGPMRQLPPNSGAGGAANLPRLPAATGGAAQAAGADRLPVADALTATEQAIQLDELIKWIRAQAKVDNNSAAVASPPGD